MRFKTVVVTGGRDYQDAEMVNDVLDFLLPPRLVIGDAKGADTLAWEWAKARPDQHYSRHIAEWDLHGKKAGPLRNKAMLDDAGTHAVVVAFKGGAGTEDCIRQAKARNMIILRVEP